MTPAAARARHLRRPTTAVAAALSLTMALSACGDAAREPERPPPTPPRAEQSRPAEAPAGQQLARLLERRADALASRDPRRLSATATGRQRERDARLAGAAADIPLRRVAYRIRNVNVDGAEASLRVTLEHGVAGVDGRWQSHRRVRAVRRARGWLVRSERAARPQLPWETGSYSSATTRHFRILYPAGVDPLRAGFGAELEAAYETVRRRLPGARPQRRLLVLVAADPAAARSLTGGLAGIEQLSALTDVSLQTTGPAQAVSAVTGLRILVPWSDFAARAPESRRRILVHELVHAVLAGRTSGRTPAWLQEGIALYVSGDRRDSLAAAYTADERGRLRLAALSQPDAIGRLGGEGLSAAYALASATAFHIADRAGEDALLRLLDAFSDPALSGPAGARLGDAAVRRTLGVGLRRLERDVRGGLDRGRG